MRDRIYVSQWFGLDSSMNVFGEFFYVCVEFEIDEYWHDLIEIRFLSAQIIKGEVQRNICFQLDQLTRHLSLFPVSGKSWVFFEGITEVGIFFYDLPGTFWADAWHAGYVVDRVPG